MIALIFDCESSGLIDSHLVPLDRQPEVIEFTGLLVNFDTGLVLEEVDTFVKPRRSISDEITKITGILNEDLANAPSFENVAESVFGLIERSPLVIAHNLSYDKELLILEGERLKRFIKWPRQTCTVEASISLKGFRLSLQGLHEHLFGQGFTGAHRARTDVEALARCCAQLIQDDEI